MCCYGIISNTHSHDVSWCYLGGYISFKNTGQKPGVRTGCAVVEQLPLYSG